MPRKHPKFKSPKIEISFDFCAEEVKKLQGSRKRKRTVLSIQQKVDLINALESGVSAAELCKKYVIGSSTLYELKTRKNELMEFYNNGYDMETRKTLRSAGSTELDTHLHHWYLQCREHGFVVTGPMLTEKAKMIYKQLGIEKKCYFSSGWLARFKARHGIRLREDFVNGATVSEKALERGGEGTHEEEETDDFVSGLGSSSQVDSQTPDDDDLDESGIYPLRGQPGKGSSTPNMRIDPQSVESDEQAERSVSPPPLYNGNIFELLTESSSTPNTSIVPSVGEKDKDADELFFSSLACEVKCLPNMKKAHLKLKMMNLVVEALKEQESQTKQS